MKVLITGAAGFLGRHFFDALFHRGNSVWGSDIVTDRRALLGDAINFFRNTVDHFDLVIHCAAVAPHRSAIDGTPLTVGAGNLELDSALFQWASRSRPGRVVYFSSSAAYPTWLQDREYRLAEGDMNRALQPDAIYGAVKVMGERLAEAYRQQGGAVTVVRPFSGYGEDQSPNFPFGAFTGRAKRREDPYVIWGDGTQVRDWVHVDDVVGAVLAAVDAGVDGPLNICTGVGTSMFELACLFQDAAGYDPVIELLEDKPAGVAYRVGDPTRSHEIYKPRITIAEGVARALEVVDAVQ